MSKFPNRFLTVAAAALFAFPAVAQEGAFGLGREALPEEVAAWNTDIRPDGLGLPEGSGDVWTGEEVFVEKCAMCHGDFGEAVGRWPVLAGGWGTLSDKDPVKTIGSYWPYLSTVYDYVRRSMPFGAAQTMSNDDVYAITAYILYVNNIVEDDFELSNENFLDVRLPNEDNFYMDDREETEFPVFVRPDICMENCKDDVEITARATFLDVTPDDPSDDAPAEEPVADEPVVEEEAEPAGPDPELVAAGEGVFRQCRACHQVGDSARNATGPNLNGVVGSAVGTVDGFRYSSVFKDATEAGDVWTHDRLAAFLADPRGEMRGTRMSFAGLRKPEDIEAIIAYLSTFDR